MEVLCETPIASGGTAAHDHAHTIIQEDNHTLNSSSVTSSSAHTQSLLPSSRMPPGGLDLISNFAVKVSGNLGEQIFDSEDEDDPQVSWLTRPASHLMYMSVAWHCHGYQCVHLSI